MKRAGSDMPHLQIKLDTNARCSRLRPRLATIKFDTTRQRCVANLTGFLQTNTLSFLSLGSRKNLGFQCRDGRRGQFGAGLGDGLFGNVAHELSPLVEVEEEFVEFGLDALAHTAEHDGDQRGQRQLASAAKELPASAWRAKSRNCGGVQEQRKRGEQGR